MTNPEFNKAIKDWHENRLREYSLDELRRLSAGCGPYMLNGIRPAEDLQNAINEEIRRKETAEIEQRTTARDHEKIGLVKNLDGKVSSIDGRLTTLEREASRSVFRKVEFWIAIAALIIALVSLLRDYWGWNRPSHPTSAEPTVGQPSRTNGN